MDIQELNKYFDLVRKKADIQETLENIQSMADRMEHPVSDGGYCNDTDSDAVDVTIMELKEQIERCDAEMSERRPALDAFVAGIDDIYIRTVFRLRFIQGLRWKEVAALMGGSNTDENMKATCYRYLRKLKKVEEKKG